MSYRASLLVLIASPILAMVWYWYAVAQTTHQVNEFHLIPVRSGNASGQIDLREGRHTVWLYGPLVSVRRHSATEYRKVLTPRLTDCASATPVPVQRIQSQVFNVGGREGRSLWTIDAPTAANYCLEVTGRYDPDVGVMWPMAIALSTGSGLRVLVRPWFVVILFSGVSIAIALAVATHLRRRRLVAALERPWAERPYGDSPSGPPIPERDPKD